MIGSQSSPQEYLSGGCTLAEVLSNRIKYSISALLHSVSGGKTSLKMADWWLGLTTPNQCGENPGFISYVYKYNCVLFT